MDYSQLSDFEINKLVAEIVYSIEVVAEDFYAKDVPFAYHRDGQVFIFIDEPLSGAWRSYNPCNNPSDAWPIITENKISIYAMSEDDKRGLWGAEAFYPNEAYHFNNNPLRAAMIVFLMKQEHSNA